MECDPESIICELDQISDAMNQFDLVGFLTTLIATVLGLLIPIAIAWLVFRGELKLRREERREDAFLRVIDAIAGLSTALWEHEHRLAALRVAGIGNAASNRGQFEPAGPANHGVKHAIAAARVVAKSRTDLEALLAAWQRVKSTDDDDTWEKKSYTLTNATNDLSNHIRTVKPDSISE